MNNNCCNNNIYPDMDMNRWEVCNSTMLANAENYYTKKQVDDLLEDIEASGQCECDLSDYYTEEEINLLLGDKLDTSAYTPTDLSDYYTKEQVDASLSGKADVSDIPSLSGYATEQWVENKGYLTQHQPIKTINGISMVGTGNIEIGSGGTTDLSNYYNKQEVDAIVSRKADVSDIPSLEGYATEQWVQNQGYLTQHQSLSEYYTKQEVNAIASGKADASTVTAINSSLTAHTSNTDIHVTSQEKAAWNAKLDASAYTPTDLSNYWTTAQTQSAITASVSGKAETSAVTAHTSNTAIHVSSNEKYNWNTAYNNYFDRNNIWCGSEADFNTATTSGTNINPDIIYFIY